MSDGSKGAEANLEAIMARRMTQDELARLWQISGRTLERWRSERYGPAWVTIGGSIRYRMSDVLAFEAAHRKRP